MAVTVVGAVAVVAVAVAVVAVVVAVMVAVVAASVVPGEEKNVQPWMVVVVLHEKERRRR